VNASTVANGITQRVIRLSRNGTTDVVNENTWLDSVVRAFVDLDRFPPGVMPVVSVMPVMAPTENSTPTTSHQENQVHPVVAPQPAASGGQQIPRQAIASNDTNGQHDPGNSRVGMVEPRLSLTPLINQIERMQTE
jgi:hypothetical protein